MKILDLPKIAEEIEDDLEEPIVGRSVAVALSIFWSRNMILKKAVWKGRTNDEN